MVIVQPCKVCNLPTRNIEENKFNVSAVPIAVYLCSSCVEMMQRERMNEIWSFDGTDS